MKFRLAIVNEQGQSWDVLGDDDLSEYNLDKPIAQAEVAIAIQLRMKEAEREGSAFTA